MEEAPADIPAPWVAINGDDGLFYYNEDTGESQWEPPAAEADSAVVEGDAEYDPEAQVEAEHSPRQDAADEMFVFGPQPEMPFIEARSLGTSDHTRVIMADTPALNTAPDGVQATLSCARQILFRVQTVINSDVPEDFKGDPPSEGDVFVDLAPVDPTWSGLDDKHLEGMLTVLLAGSDLEEAFFSSIQCLVRDKKRVNRKQELGSCTTAELIERAHALFPEVTGHMVESDVQIHLDASAVLAVNGSVVSCKSVSSPLEESALRAFSVLTEEEGPERPWFLLEDELIHMMGSRSGDLDRRFLTSSPLFSFREKDNEHFVKLNVVSSGDDQKGGRGNDGDRGNASSRPTTSRRDLSRGAGRRRPDDRRDRDYRDGGRNGARHHGDRREDIRRGDPRSTRSHRDGDRSRGRREPQSGASGRRDEPRRDDKGRDDARRREDDRRREEYHKRSLHGGREDPRRDRRLDERRPEERRQDGRAAGRDHADRRQDERRDDRRGGDSRRDGESRGGGHRDARADAPRDARHGGGIARQYDPRAGRDDRDKDRRQNRSRSRRDQRDRDSGRPRHDDLRPASRRDENGQRESGNIEDRLSAVMSVVKQPEYGTSDSGPWGAPPKPTVRVQTTAKGAAPKPMSVETTAKAGPPGNFDDPFDVPGPSARSVGKPSPGPSSVAGARAVPAASGSVSAEVDAPIAPWNRAPKAAAKPTSKKPKPPTGPPPSHLRGSISQSIVPKVPKGNGLRPVSAPKPVGYQPATAKVGPTTNVGKAAGNPKAHGSLLRVMAPKVGAKAPTPGKARPPGPTSADPKPPWAS